MTKATELFTQLVWFGGMLVAALIAGYIIVRIVRRRSMDGGAAKEAFTLQDLREMRAAGQISESEFESMKAGLIGRLRTPASGQKRIDERKLADD